MDAGAIALTIDEAAAMVHFNQGVDTGKDVFVSRDLLFRCRKRFRRHHVLPCEIL